MGLRPVTDVCDRGAAKGDAEGTGRKTNALLERSPPRRRGARARGLVSQPALRAVVAPRGSTAQRVATVKGLQCAGAIRRMLLLLLVLLLLPVLDSSVLLLLLVLLPRGSARARVARGPLRGRIPRRRPTRRRPTRR